ncbi:hypothetical protein [Paenibacillus sp. JJ-223]|uniref:hypothetical protein n=1 Tax=Paenibacillus sp. JJ-223 TaxID=2905647 RepID=UPI001F322F22|nr:hypothetical protein [Paenibacillus sp. JJ-223]CAH1210048.1 hypothetical protein PAECIP111890_03400 [Paenibacillus sp. JJ-223]
MSTGYISLLVVIFGSITGLITILVVMNTIRAKQRELKRRKEILLGGIPAKAVIRHIAETSSSMDGRPGVRMDLTVTPDNESSFDAVVETYISVLAVPRFQKGSEIDVKYQVIGGKKIVEVAEAYIP